MLLSSPNSSSWKPPTLPPDFRSETMLINLPERHFRGDGGWATVLIGAAATGQSSTATPDAPST